MRIYPCLVGAVALFFCRPAICEPVSYTEIFNASGIFNGMTFTNQTVTLVGYGDTSNIPYYPPNYPYQANATVPLTEATLSLGGVTADLLDPLAVSYNSHYYYVQIQPIGVYDLPLLKGGFSSPSTILAENETGDGPIGDFGGQFNSSLGLITLTDPAINAESGTFTTTLGASPVPEPSSVVLLGTGLLGVAGAVRRRFS